MNILELFSKIGISQSFMQDFSLLIVVVLLTVVIAIFIGRQRLVSLLIGIYITLALIGAVPEKYFKEYSYELICFFIFLIAITIFGKRIFGAYVSASEFMWRIFTLAFLEVMMILSIIFSILPEKTALGYISKNAYKYLVSPEYQLFWLIIPLVFVYIIRKRLS